MQTAEPGYGSRMMLPVLRAYRGPRVALPAAPHTLSEVRCCSGQQFCAAAVHRSEEHACKPLSDCKRVPVSNDQRAQANESLAYISQDCRGTSCNDTSSVGRKVRACHGGGLAVCLLSTILGSNAIYRVGNSVVYFLPPYCNLDYVSILLWCCTAGARGTSPRRQLGGQLPAGCRRRNPA
jgi:hypothetical protein